MPKTQDLWHYLRSARKKILMYGMGNGADKILSVCESYGIEVADFFASDGFVRGHLFHGKRVLSYSEACEKYGRENMIVLLSFASSLPEVLENIYRIASECELYAPDVPVTGDRLFNLEFYNANEEKFALVESLLADGSSRRIYRAVVDFKLSGDVRLLHNDVDEFSDVYNLLGASSFGSVADLGAYNGDTLRELSAHAPNLKTAVAFEPDKRNFKKLSDYADLENRFTVKPIHAAAWSRKEILQFDSSGNRNATLLAHGGMAVRKQAKVAEIPADSLDHLLDGAPVDYIKFDVEGAEREAFLGAIETIAAYKPALLMSLYHRSEDLFALPLLIHEHFPDYRFCLRRRRYIPAWDVVLICVKGARGEACAEALPLDPI